MMRLILLFILILFFRIINVKAQVFDPQTEWYYCQTGFPPDGERCHIFDFDQVSGDPQDTLVATFKSIFGALRVKQHDQKVWINDTLNYDFGRNLNDTFFIRDFFEDLDWYVLDSIKVKSLFGRDRIVQFISNNDDKKVMVEGLGTAVFFDEERLEEIDYFFDPGIVKVNFIADPALSFSYFNDGQNKIATFPNKGCETCDKVVMIEEVTQITPQYDLKIANELLTISGLTGPSIIQLYNTSGQLLQNIEKVDAEVEISLSNQNAGVYFLRIVNMENGKVSTLRFVKSD